MTRDPMMAALRQAAAAMPWAVGEMALEEDNNAFNQGIHDAKTEVASRRAEENWRRVVQALRLN